MSHKPRKAWPGLACGFPDFLPFKSRTRRAEARATLGGLGQPSCTPWWGEGGWAGWLWSHRKRSRSGVSGLSLSNDETGNVLGIEGGVRALGRPKWGCQELS